MKNFKIINVLKYIYNILIIIYTIYNKYYKHYLLLLFLILLCILIIFLNKNYFYKLLEIMVMSNYTWNYLEDHVKVHDIIVEYCQGWIIFYNIDGNMIDITKKFYSTTKNFKIYKKYPVELVVLYDIYFHRDDFSLMSHLIKTKFSDCIMTAEPTICTMWSEGNKRYESSYLIGEEFLGKIKNMPFQFMCFIQDADGFKLEHEDKAWPILKRILKGPSLSSKHMQYIIHFEMDQKTLHIRKGSITSKVGMQTGQILIDFYNKTYKLKPSIFLSFNKKQFQLIWIDLPMNTYYIDWYKKKASLDYVKRFYKIERFLFMKEWCNRYYNQYDKKL